jgi:serine/threonine protein kinase/tetratricopeptide (TPR) repeat protein
MGAVNLVVDTFKDHRQLALKQIRRDRSNPRSVAILRNEFIALAALEHPNLAKVYDFGFDRRTEDYYFTSAYVRGIQLYKATHGLSLADANDLHLVLHLLVEVLRALEFIHSRGLVHGDLKPENLLVSTQAETEDDPGGGAQVKLIDFGLAKREKDFGGKKIFGTSWYIAPETILGAQVDRRTDLYSLGVVFYHVLTRKLPYQSKENFEVLRGHLEEEARPPSEIVPEVPRKLDGIILRLMAKKPADRYASAVAVIHDLNEKLGTRFPLETSETVRGYLRSSPLVGQRPAFNQLWWLIQHLYAQPESVGGSGLSLLEDAEAGGEEGASDNAELPSGHFLLVRGERKIGKERFVREFKGLVQTRATQFIQFELEEEGEADKKNLKCLFLALGRAFTSDENPLFATLSRLLKSLLSSVDNSPAEKLNGAIDVLVDGLLSAARELPMVLVFSRLHRAGEPLLSFLALLVDKIVRCGDHRPPLLILATVLEDELERLTLRRLLLSPSVRSHFRELPLERLPREEVEKLLALTFPGHRFGPEFENWVYEESDGNPGMVHELLEALAGRGQLEHLPGGWRYTGQIGGQRLTSKLRSGLKSRIAGFDDAARRLGLAFAFLGNGCELDLAAQLSGIEPSKILPTLLLLKKERILREDGEGRADRYSFTHPSVRELFLDLAQDEEARAIHLKAGMILEERFNAGVEKDARRLARHYLRSTKQESGIRYGLLAARHLALQHQPRRALEVYWEMRRLCDASSIPDLRRVEFEMARLDALIGNRALAEATLQRLVDSDAGSTDACVSRADLLIELAHLQCFQGAFRRSGLNFKAAFQSLKGQGPSSSLAKLLLGYAWLFQIRGNFLESYRYCEKALPLVEQLDELGRTQLHLLASENHFQLGDLTAAIQACCEGLRVLDGLRGSGPLGFVFYCLGKFYFYKGKFENSVQQFGLASQAFHRVGFVDWEGLSLREMGNALLVLEQASRARVELLRAQSLLETSGFASALAETLLLLGESHRRLGRTEEAELNIRSAMGLFSKLGVSRKAKDVHTLCARLCIDRGQLDQASEFLAQLESSAKGEESEDEASVMSRLELLAQIARMKGDFKTALDAVTRGSIRAQSLANRMLALPILEVRARLYLDLGKDDDAQRALDQLTELAGKYRLEVLSARVCTLRGWGALSRQNLQGAVRLFEYALKILKERDSEAELVETYLGYGRSELDRGMLENSRLYLEEGFYLVKKLNLSHLRCQYLFALGLLESKSRADDPSRPIQYFQSAAKLAAKSGFNDILWRVLLEHGRCLLPRRVADHAPEVVAAGLECLRNTLERLPSNCRDSYPGVAALGVFSGWQDQVAAAAKESSGPNRSKALAPIKEGQS